MSVSVLAHPRHPIVESAYTLAVKWCQGHEIDGAPALTHAIRVAQVLHEHVPAAPPDLIAAALLHDSPEFAPELEEPEDLDFVLDNLVGVRTRSTIRELERQHDTMGDPEPVFPEDRDTLLVSAADKIVSLDSILKRGAGAEDPEAFWEVRRPFLDAVPYFCEFLDTVGPELPGSMADELGRLVAAAQRLCS